MMLSVGEAFAQGRATVSGYITDEATGETLIGAAAMEGSDGAITNSYGFYTLSLKKGQHSITYSYIGYADQVVEINLQKDTTINIILKPDMQLEGATVAATKEAGIASTKMSAIELPMKIIQKTPVLFGEHDVLKTLQLMPGVQSGSQGFSGMYVRGGGPDENLLLLDGVGLYNAEHMLGIFSIFQPEAVKKVTLYKGSFPARYGGRVSSIVDVRTNDGNMKEYHGTVGIGVISDKFHFEGPIIKDKLAFSLSARGMHTLFFNKVIQNYLDANYYFYDLNGKLTWRISDKDRVFINAYHGRDVFRFDNDTESTASNETISTSSTTNFDITWGNTVVATNWNHVFNNKLFFNMTAAYTRYLMDVGVGLLSSYTPEGATEPSVTKFALDYDSGMRDYTLKADFDYTPVPEHLIKFGGEYVRHVFLPQTGSVQFDMNANEAVMDTSTVVNASKELKGNELSFYAEDDWAINDRLNINPGFKLSIFMVDGKTYFCPEPRFSIKYNINDDYSVKAAYSRMSQYVHLLSYSDMNLPVDLWVPITKDIKPVTSDQISSGVYYNGLEGWEFSLEAYYKWTHNVLEYQDGVTMMSLANNIDWEACVEMGEGRSRGIELFIQKTMGKTTGWLGYTLAWSDRTFSTLNGGETFPYKYDNRHNLSLVINHDITDRLNLGATWTFATGGTMTLPERQTVLLRMDGTMDQYALISSRNNYRLPSSHKLNIGLNYTVPKKRGEAVWDFSIYNVYNRMNANFVMNTSSVQSYDEDVQQYVVKLKKITVLPIIPSIGWTRKF